jgi:predicted nucleic-acid-binding Zn-ribbon protein
VTTVRCLVCNSQEMENDTVIMQGKWSRLVNYSNKKYNAISCKDCGYTMLFKQNSKFNILEAIMG